MKLRSTQEGHDRLTERQRWQRVGAVLGAALVLIVFGALLHSLAVRFEIDKKARGFATNLRGYASARMRAEPQRIRIDIEHEHYLKIVEKREKALAQGLLVSSPDDMVPATIGHDGKTIAVKMRLKGDFRDHWAGDKWSFRIRVKGDDTLFGMKQFSIQHPQTRGYFTEWMMHAALRREGLIALRYDFIEVVLNGRDLGVYALEEHFDKRLLENNERREGPVVRFNEDRCLGEIRTGMGTPCGATGSGSYFAAEGDTFQTNRLLAAPASAALVHRAVGLLEGFQRGELTTSQVFDVPQLARYFAVLEAFGATHSANWRNARFYLNPVTSRLEPIGFDGAGELDDSGPVKREPIVPLRGAMLSPHRDNLYYYHLAYFDRLFEDEAFYAAYLRELDRVSRPEYLEGMLDEIGPELEAALAVLQTEFPWKGVDHRRFDTLRRWLHGSIHPLKSIHAYIESQDSGQVTLDVANLQYLPIELLGVDGAKATVEPVGLAGRSPSSPLVYQRITLPAAAVGDNGADSAAIAGDEGPELGAVALRFRTLGLSEERTITAFPWPRRVILPSVPDITRAPANAASFEFVEIDEASRRIDLRPGVWRVDRDLIFPAGHRVHSGPGVELILGDGVVVISHSALEWIGSERAPVRVTTEGGEGQAVVVLAEGESSVLEYVHFVGLAEPRREGWGVTGAVTFYESPVSVRNSEFAGARAEDALNLVRSAFDIRKSVFKDAASDAFDADFSNGTLGEVMFLSPGNDGVDVSGSVVKIEGLWVTNPGDKGLSAGENSRVTGSQIRIRGAALAVASKDLSETRLSDVEISGSAIGFAAFQKKSEFGGASLEVSGLRMDQVESPYLIEHGSHMQVDGTPVTSNQDRVREMLYTE